MSRRVAWLLAAGLVLALAVGLLAWRAARPGSELERALSAAPAGTLRATWTDWSAVRREVGVRDPRGAAGLTRLLDRGFERDLTSTSALLSSAEPMRAELGLSPANLAWELLAQGPDGAVVTMGLPESFSVDRLGARLERLGYRRPDAPDGVWRGTPEIAATTGFTPELQYVVVLEDQGLVLASDTQGYAGRAAAVALGDRPSVSGLEEVVEPAGSPVSAVVYTGEYGCEQLAMAQADGADAAQGEQLITAAGGLNPYTSLAMTLQPDGSMQVLLGFESEEQARADADARAQLAKGPAPGQGGDFSERFRVRSVQSEGTLLTMDLRPRRDAYVLSDLSSGPVLFASC